MMAGFDKGGYVSSCVEITVTNHVVNPDQLKNRVAGGTRILNPRLSKYRVPPVSDMPEIEVVLVDRKDLPSTGKGETPILALAPSVGNASFDRWVMPSSTQPQAPACDAVELKLA